MVRLKDQDMDRKLDSGHPATCPARVNNKADLKVASLALACDQCRESRHKVARAWGLNQLTRGAVVAWVVPG